MTRYIKFTTDDNHEILVEVDEKQTPGGGLSKAGLKEVATKAVTEAEALFENAIRAVLQLNVETFYAALSKLPHPPTDFEIVFGIKATGELGNFVISKISGEANYSIKLTWKALPTLPHQ